MYIDTEGIDLADDDGQAANLVLMESEKRHTRNDTFEYKAMRRSPLECVCCGLGVRARVFCVLRSAVCVLRVGLVVLRGACSVFGGVRSA